MTVGFGVVLGVALPLAVGFAKALPIVTTMSVNWLLVASRVTAPGNSLATSSALSSSPAWYVITVVTKCFADELIVGTWNPFATSRARSVPAKPTLPVALISLIVTSLGDGSDCPVF